MRFFWKLWLMISDLLKDMIWSWERKKCSSFELRGLWRSRALTLHISIMGTYQFVMNRKILIYIDLFNAGSYGWATLDWSLWMSQYQPKVRQCTEINVKHKHDKNKLSKLSMNHLLGAFIALLTGYVASLTVFIRERFVFWFNYRNFGSRFCKIADDWSVFHFQTYCTSPIDEWDRYYYLFVRALSSFKKVVCTNQTWHAY